MKNGKKKSVNYRLLMEQNMRILITGVNGFLGRGLATALHQCGHQVMGLGRQQVPAVVLDRYIQGDVLEEESLLRAAKDCEVIIHLAALTSHAEIVEKKFETGNINLRGTQQVLQVFTSSPTLKKFLYASTGKVYGTISSLPITEEHPARPLNILGKSKMMAEQLIDFYASPEKSLIILRIFNIYGPGQKETFLVPTILHQLKQGSSITLGDVAAQRDYTYIDDVVAAFVLAVEKNVPTGVSTLNICSGQATSAQEIVSHLETIRQQPIIIQRNVSLLRQDEMACEYGSYARAEKMLGWKPRLGLKEGLQKTWEMFK